MNSAANTGGFRRFRSVVLGLAVMGAMPASAAVKLTALQIISTDAAGKIQGVGAHRFRTSNHGGHPAIFVVPSDDMNGSFVNGPGIAQNGLDLTVSGGTHTYTVYAEKTNSYSWTNYTMNFFFDLSNAPQLSALAALNTASTLFFPPMSVNPAQTENLAGHLVKAGSTLVYTSGQTEVKLVSFHFSSPSLYGKDRVSPFEAKSNRILDYVGQFTLEVTAPPEISLGGVVNAASFMPKVAPGALFSVFGSDLAPAPVRSTTVPLASDLGGTTVTIGGKRAPLVFVSPGQINAQVPYEVLASTTVPVVVSVNGVASQPVNVSVVPAAPGIFQFGERRAVVQNADYSINTTDNAADGGSYIVAYLTGSGEPDVPVPTGGVAKGNPLSRAKGTVTATVNGAFAEVAFAGLTPEFIGLMQVNLRVPGVPPGNYPLVVSINGEKSNAAMITIK